MADRYLLDRFVRIQTMPHMPADPPVQFAHGIGRPRKLEREHRHAEGFLLVVRVDPAQFHHFGEWRRDLPAETVHREIGRASCRERPASPGADGIRDYKVTGVQTCALPISGYKQCHICRLTRPCSSLTALADRESLSASTVMQKDSCWLSGLTRPSFITSGNGAGICPRKRCIARSEERRAGKDRRARVQTAYEITR